MLYLKSVIAKSPFLSKHVGIGAKTPLRLELDLVGGFV
jgi:hypothetical protein